MPCPTTMWLVPPKAGAAGANRARVCWTHVLTMLAALSLLLCFCHRSKQRPPTLMVCKTCNRLDEIKEPGALSLSRYCVVLASILLVVPLSAWMTRTTRAKTATTTTTTITTTTITATSSGSSSRGGGSASCNDDNPGDDPRRMRQMQRW